MIVEESSSCRHKDTITVIPRNNSMAAGTDATDLKKNSYAAASPDGSQYSRAAKSMLEESDDEEEGEDKGALSRNPSLVDESIFLDEYGGDRDGEEALDSVGEQQSKNFIYCAPSGNPICHGEFLTLPSCHLEFPGLPGCQGNMFAEQLDMMAQCRHPLDLFLVFQHDQGVGGEPSERLLPGMHFIPRSCEYCGAEDTDYCTRSCQRPKSFFFKKRPPLSPTDETLWDPETDVAIRLEEPKPIESIPIERRQSALLRDFFR